MLYHQPNQYIWVYSKLEKQIFRSCFGMQDCDPQLGYFKIDILNKWKHSFIIGPESDHWLCLSLTDKLAHCRLVNLIDVTLACEDANSKLVEVVTVVDVDDEKRVDNSLVEDEIWS